MYMFSSNNNDDTEVLRQMRLLYYRSNRLFRMFNKCSKMCLLNCVEVYVRHFIVLTFGLFTKKGTFSTIRVSYNNVYRKLLGLCRRSKASKMCVINKRVRVRVRKIYFDNEKHDIEETNTETFMCRSMSATNAYTKL